MSIGNSFFEESGPAPRLSRPVRDEADSMSVYELNRAIHHIYIDRERTYAFRREDYAVLERFDLTSEERQALTGRDFPKLWSLHVHPVLLFHLSAVLNPREWYIQNVVPKIQGVPNMWYDYYEPQSPQPAAEESAKTA
jgi:hypothetical protein